MDSGSEQLIEAIRSRAERLYVSKQLLCSEAVLVAINEALGGGLTEDQAIGLAAGLPMGLGDSGCLCGALSGGALSLGLILSNGKCMRRRKEIRQGAKQLHDWFKGAHKSACCRVLSKKVKGDPKKHFDQCASLTAETAEMTARLILEARPELVEQARRNYFPRQETATCSRLKRIMNVFCR